MSDLFHEDIPDAFIQRGLRRHGRGRTGTRFQILTKRHERLAELAPRSAVAAERLDGRDDREPALRPPRRLLRDVPAGVRFISAEPLLGPLEGLDLDRHRLAHRRRRVRARGTGRSTTSGFAICATAASRPSVAFFFKQWGGLRSKTGGRLLDGRHLGRDARGARRSASMTRNGSRTWGYWTRANSDTGGLPRRLREASSGLSERIYLDAFAGEGSGLDRLTGEEFPGSARIALEAGAAPGSQNSATSSRADARLTLRLLRADYPGRDIKVYAGDCNETIFAPSTTFAPSIGHRRSRSLIPTAWSWQWDDDRRPRRP